MEKLELKHLAPYLPYGLKLLVEYGRTGDTEQYTLGGSDGKGIISIDHIHFGAGTVKPILRPLSDLTKEIDIDGWFVPMKHLMHDYRDSLSVVIEKNDSLYLQSISLDYDNLSGDYVAEDRFNIDKYNLLLEWHFDVFGLIEKGLAIDINTL